jgi:hypothetical protein
MLGTQPRTSPSYLPQLIAWLPFFALTKATMADVFSPSLEGSEVLSLDPCPMEKACGISVGLHLTEQI